MIFDINECKAAALKLNLEDSMALQGFQGFSFGPTRPDGCYFNKSNRELYLNHNGSRIIKDEYHVQLCSSAKHHKPPTKAPTVKGEKPKPMSKYVVNEERCPS